LKGFANGVKNLLIAYSPNLAFVEKGRRSIATRQ
jgi:hypothetical protein